MKTIRISDEVWNAIAALGKFGETEDQVLRRVFKFRGGDPNSQQTSHAWKKRKATERMTQTINGNKIILEFDRGPRFERSLPPKDDHHSIRKLRDEAVEFVQSNGGTKGQEHAAIKALTSRGYFVTVKRPMR